jgi:asparagine synthase (glutamine-hydrolysing)
VRWRTTSRSKRFFTDELRQQVGSTEGTEDAVFYPPDYHHWDALSQAQYLEVSIFLSQYLLSSQGDRVAMANSVEGRYPFLDYRVVEYCNSLPPEWKLNGLTEKYLLRQLAKEWLPEEIWKRRKRPYRAPIHRSFFNESTPDYVHELLSPNAIGSAGLFKPEAVQQMVNKVSQGGRLSETDDMALAGILSTQLVHQQFISEFKIPSLLSATDDVKVCIR